MTRGSSTDITGLSKYEFISVNSFENDVLDMSQIDTQL